MSMRIGYVLKRFPRFSETFILNELLSLQRLGVEVDVFSLLKPPAEARHARLNQLCFPVIELGSVAKRIGIPAAASTGLQHGAENSKPVSSALFSGKSTEEIAALHVKAAVVATQAQFQGITHLHAHFGSDATTVALLASRMIRGSFSFTAHARDIFHTYVNASADKAMRRVKIDEAAFVVTVSDYNANHLKQLAPESAERIFRLYNGIDLSMFSPVTPAAQLPGRLIAVGRLVEKKGFPHLVQACAELRRRGVSFDCRLIGDGPLRDSLANQINQLNLSDAVHLEGALPQEQLISMMDTASLAVLPCVVAESGDRDGLPTVLLEAMAKALPVVTTTVSGGPEIVDHGSTGLLCAPENPVLLADALERLLRQPEHAREMGRKGLEKAMTQFDLHHNVSSLQQKFLSHCLSRTSPERAA